MEAIHVFIKGRNGNGVFYRTEDFLVLISIVGTIAREMGISIIAFCPMFNHVHILVRCFIYFKSFCFDQAFYNIIPLNNTLIHSFSEQQL